MTDQPADKPLAGVVPHINLDGASDASAFYQRAFAAEEISRQPAEDGKRLLHCRLLINGGTLLLSDCFPEFGITNQPSPCSRCISRWTTWMRGGSARSMPAPP